MTDNSKKQQTSHISLLVLYFFVASAGGFLWEVLLFFVKEGRFCNRGFLYGPWLPVYGTGAVLMSLFLSSLRRQPAKVFLYSLLTGTSLELIIGIVLDHFWGLRYWDYSNAPLNFQGYICLASALGIGLGGTLWVCLFAPLLKKFWLRLRPKTRKGILLVLLCLFAADCAVALLFPNTGRGITFPAWSYYTKEKLPKSAPLR